MATEFEDGFLVGLLVGEGHFGGDGRQPQVTLRMHERHEPLFRWLERSYAGGRLYGPYDHGGRRYYQWMVRGAYLREVLVPLLHARLTPALDRYAHDRFLGMCARYPTQLGLTDAPPPPDPRGEPEIEVPPGSARPESPGGSHAPPKDAARVFAVLRGATSTETAHDAGERASGRGAAGAAGGTASLPEPPGATRDGHTDAHRGRS